MLDKTYYDVSTGENINILNEDINFYTLSNGVRIKKDVFLKRYEERQEIDPNNFFKSNFSNDPLYNLANKIKSMDTSNVSDNDSGTKVKYTPPVVLSDTSLPPGAVLKQPQVEEQISLTPDQKRAMLEEWKRTHPGAQINDVQNRTWEDENEETKPVYEQKNIKPEPKVDPLQMMFKMFKNNYPIKLNLVIEENIPNPSFIGMIQENVEADAIEYYSNLISDKILKDTKKLRVDIYNQLKEIVNNELGISDKKEES